MKRPYRTILYFLILSFLRLGMENQPCFAAGGIVTDGTLGASPPKTLSGTNLNIPENMGERHGGNLFHSFKEFNIHIGQTVTFQENVAKSTDNVISRVTGNLSSNINGTLKVTPDGRANFYLINPHGVIFGSGGQVDVPGSVHISTADQLKFKDDKIFSAVNPVNNSLSSAPPSAFGFLGTSTSNNGLIKIDSAFINVKENKVFDAVAGQIIISNNNGSANIISATNGEVRLIASHGSGEVSVEPNKNGNLPLPTIKPSRTTAGDIQIKKNAFISLIGDGGGRVAIWGGDLTISEFGAIDVINNGSANPSKNNGVTINAYSMLLQDGSIESINQFSSAGKSANVIISIEKDLIIDNGFIKTNSSGINNSGNIAIKSGSVIIKGHSTIATYNLLEGNSKGGNITIIADRDISLLKGGRITTLHNGGEGVIGNINLISDGDIIINSAGEFSTPSGVFAQTNNEAKAGNIVIFTKGNIRILNGGQIDNSTSGNGNAGNVIIKTDQNLLIDGQENVKVDTLITSRASPGSRGNAGKVTISAAGDFILNKGAKVSSDTSGQGQGGTVSVNAKRILFSDSSISAASKTRFSGKPGNVQVTAEKIIDLNNAKISIENSSEISNAIKKETVSQLLVSAAKINLKDSQITTQATGNTPAGSVAINFANALCLDSSFISTESKDGDGGALSAKGGTLINLKNSGFKTTVTGIKGNGGNINVNADNLAMETGLIQANTEAKEAKGGNINLNLKALIPSGNQLLIGGTVPVSWQRGIFGLNVIQAAAPSGLSGTIQSNTPALNLSGVLANLGNPQFDSRPLNADNCTIGVGSSLTRLGKGGLFPKARDAWVY